MRSRIFFNEQFVEVWVFRYFNHFIFIQICDEGNDLAVVDEIEFLNCCIFGHFIGYVRGNGDSE